MRRGRFSTKSLTSQAGAFDLPSIAVGVLAVGILALGVMAAVFGVIPWTQDNAAKQDLTAVRTAEGVALVRDGVFYHSAGLATARYLPTSERLEVAVDAAGACYVGLAKSATGKVFYATDSGNDPRELTPTTSIDGKLPGCLSTDTATGLVTSVGGFDGSDFDPVGSGSGTEADPGIGAKTSAAEAPQDPAGPGRVTGLTVYKDSFEVAFKNTAAASYRMPYSVDVACRNTSTGTVTVERISGYVDLAGNEAATRSLVACIPGTEAVDVSVPTYAGDGNVYRWRTNYQYPYAEPVTRGVTASAFRAVAGSAPGPAWCIENRSNATTAGNPVDLAACADKDAQRWQWSGDGAFRQSTLADKCLTADAAHKLVLGACNDSGSQHFTAEPFQGSAAEEGLIQIRVQGTGECVTIPGGTLAGVQLTTETCNGTAAQGWYMPGLGLGGQTVQPKEAEGTAAIVVAYLGAVSSPTIANAGSDLTFYMTVPSGSTGRKTAAHVQLTCLDDPANSRQVNTLTTITAPSSTSYSATRTVSCGSGQLIGYSVKPVTGAGQRAVSNPAEFTGLSTAGELTWDAAADGFRTVGAASSPTINNAGSSLSFYMSMPSSSTGVQTSTHYKLLCLNADMSTFAVNRIETITAPNSMSYSSYRTVTCGTGQIIEYWLEPLTLDRLKESSNMLDAAGYTTSGDLHWDAATDGYTTVGTASSPTINNAGSSLSFYMSMPSSSTGVQTSTHYKLLCLNADMSTFAVNRIETITAPNSMSYSSYRTVTCGTGQIIEYWLEPLTLDRLKESSNMLDAAGYTTGGVLHWDASDGYGTVGTVSSASISNTGSDLSFYMSMPTGSTGVQTSTHYKILCLDADLSTRMLNRIETITAPSSTSYVSLRTVSCGTGQIIEYWLEPLTLDRLKESSNMLDAAGYTTGGDLHWDAATDGFKAVGSISSASVTNGGTSVSFYMTVPSGSTGVQTSTHVQLVCSDPDGVHEESLTTLAAAPSSTSYSVYKTVSCATGSMIGYTLGPLTLDGLKSASNMLGTAGYTTAGAFTWRKPGA